MASRTTKTSTIPLTTQFVPPTSCATQYWFPTVLPNATPDAVFALGPPEGNDGWITDCWPSDWATVAASEFYNPGICPSGYNTASQLYTSRTMFAYCCMEGYTLLAEGLPAPYRKSSIDPGDFTKDVESDAICFQPLPTPVVVEYTSINGEVFTTDLRPGRSVVHAPIRVKYAITDFSKFPIDAQPTALPAALKSDLEPFIRSGFLTLAPETIENPSSTSSRVTITSTSSVSSTSTGGADDGSSGKSTGTIAVAVGVTVGVIVLLAVGGYILFLWTRKRINRDERLHETAAGPYTKHQNNDSHVGGIQDYPDQAGGIALSESGGWSKAHQ
ncbi:hypothetical protein H072_4262 [Dactylellina haptotyla CBS 200.50]|uniref:Uncharacterized protein n=1 Tax=Dactylellina haptotyla (strain CBS 200.50) TaxID=1284197 RepID=S8BQN9_DACHA|nr:hypothetical protein H072_4262 [Dactylellina haptotyla CBS 200.50]